MAKTKRIKLVRYMHPINTSHKGWTTGHKKMNPSKQIRRLANSPRFEFHVRACLASNNVGARWTLRYMRDYRKKEEEKAAKAAKGQAFIEAFLLRAQGRKKLEKKIRKMGNCGSFDKGKKDGKD